MIYLVIIICLFLLIIVKPFFSRHLNYSVERTYSWKEILYPFNSAPISIYKQLSPENKGAFWSLSSSLLLGILTCWLGFSVQFFVINSTQVESSKLAHYQVVDKFKPLYYELFDSCSSIVFEELHKSLGYGFSDKMKLTIDDYKTVLSGQELSLEKKNTAEGNLLYFFANETYWPNINYSTKKCLEISGEIAPFLSKKQSEDLLKNNGLLLVSSQIFKALNDTIQQDSIDFVNNCVNEYAKASVKGHVTLRSNTADLYATVYTYYKYLFEIKNSNNNINNLNTRASFVSHLSKLAMYPMMENIFIIKGEFTSKTSVFDNPIKISLVILILSVFIGYMLFRIILMRFFDRNSLTPNPRMSQSDLESLNKQLKSLQKENSQNNLNVINQNDIIKRLQIDLKSEQQTSLMKEKKINELIAKLEETSLNYDEIILSIKEDKKHLTDEIKRLNEDKKHLTDEIKRLKENGDILNTSN